MVKVDCHLHTKYSKDIAITHPLSKMIGAKESYLEPEKVYQIAKKRGLDFVAITDHDTIEGALILNEEHPDIIIGEELEVKASDEGHLVHLLVYGINEQQHRDLTDLKRIGLKETGKYIRNNDLAHSLAHVSYKASKPKLSVELIDEWMKYVDCVEILNGGVVSVQNRFARNIAFLYGKNVSGGSDAHTKVSIGKAYVMSKVKTKEEFLEAFKKGDVIVGGTSCSFFDSIKVGYSLTEDALINDVLFRPLSRERKGYRKYFLDYLIALGVVAPLSLAIAPGLGIAHLHQRAQKTDIARLEKELLDYLSVKLYGSLIADKKKRRWSF